MFFCDSKWVQDTIYKFLHLQCHNIGLTDTKYNIKNNRWQNLGGSCAAVMVGYLFDPGLFYIAGVYHKLLFLEDFTSVHLVLNISIHENNKKLVEIDNSGGGYVVVICVTLYFTRLHL